MPKEGITLSGKIQLDLSHFHGEMVDSLDDVTVKLRIHRMVGAYAMAGTIQVNYHLICSRCLASSPSFLTIPVSHRLVKGEKDVDVVSFSYKDEEKVNLIPIVEELLHLALPMKPLCQVTCLGICPTCGVNRNETPCSCEDQGVDPRWSALIHKAKEILHG